MAIGGTLALTACGGGDSGDDGGGSSGRNTEAFCDEIVALAESADDATSDQLLASTRAVADVAPDEISDEMDQLVDGFEQLQAFDPRTASDEEMGRFVAMADELEVASAAIEDFATEHCSDLPADLFGNG